MQDVRPFSPKVCLEVEIRIKIMKGGENMAIMLNMLPIEQKPNTVVQKTTNKSDTKSAKSETGFAKVLTNETDKSEINTDSKAKTDDNAQFMAAMAGMVAPAVVTPLTQVTENVSEGLEKMVNNMENQLLNLEPGVAASKEATVVSVPLQAEIPVAVTKSASTENALLETQVVNTAPTAQQTKLPNMDTSASQQQQQLTEVVGTMTAVTPQVASNQLRDDLAKWQTQLQNIQNVGQVPGNDQNNADVLIDNPVVANALSNTTLATANSSLKNSSKPFDGKKIVAGQEDADITAGMKNIGAVSTVAVKPVVAPESVVAVIDDLISNDTENTDTILPNQTVKDTDNFASILNQQGLKIENQTGMTEAKTQPVSDPYNIKSQIVDQARLVAGNKNTEMIIQLKPEHLGELTFKVSVENGVVSASFHSNNGEVRNMIESSLYLLKQEMSSQGLKVDNVGVYAGLGEFFSNGQQREGYQQPTAKVNNTKTEEEFIDALESVDPIKSSLNASGVDYLV